MRTGMKKWIALLCALCLMAALFCPAALAVEEEENVPIHEIRVYVDSKRTSYGLKVENTTYVPIRDFCEAMGEEVEVSWDQETQTVTVTASDLIITATVDNQYYTANDRCFYLPDGVRNLEGTVMLPIRELAKAFNVSVHWDPDNWTINVLTDEMAVIESGETWYNEDDLYWLSRVIYAESGHEDLEGMIGVGNVVVNRAKDETSEAWPDTIYDVIFQKGQFDVVTYKTIHKTPSDEAVVAAKIVLEGYNVVGDSKFFINPDVCSSLWFDVNCAYVDTIGNHVFYA